MYLGLIRDLSVYLLTAWTKVKCLFKLPFWLKAFPQRLHWNGLAPVCTRWWRFKSEFEENVLPQLLHLNEFVCDSRWDFKVNLWLNLLLQILQMKSLSSFSSVRLAIVCNLMFLCRAMFCSFRLDIFLEYNGGVTILLAVGLLGRHEMVLGLLVCWNIVSLSISSVFMAMLSTAAVLPIPVAFGISEFKFKVNVGDELFVNTSWILGKVHSSVDVCEIISFDPELNL